MRRLATALSIAFLLAVVGVASAAAATIQLVAPWGNAVYTNTDKITLTYSISASNKVPQQAVDAVQAAIGAWQGFLDDNNGSGQFDLVPVATGMKANVPITIKNGGGKILGQTRFSVDRQGFIKAAPVSISGSSFGLANDPATLTYIAEHEFGHALVGLGHSDDSTDLMYPTIGASNPGIGACELAGFNALYSPWLTDGNSSTTPTLPSVSSVPC
jgi:predicted Zn-dependent protease